MVITSRTYTTLFANKMAAETSTSAGGLVRLPLSVVPHYETRCETTGAIIPVPNKPLFRPNLWSSEEHERFLHGLELFPNGPWKEVAKIVGTKTTRQTMTHAQKYRQKIERRMQARTKPTLKTSKQSKDPMCKLEPNSSSESHESSQQTLWESDPSELSFMDELLACNLLEDTEPTGTVASPTEVYPDAINTNFLDLEVDALLASFEPLRFRQAQRGMWEDKGPTVFV